MSHHGPIALALEKPKKRAASPRLAWAVLGELVSKNQNKKLGR